MFPKDCNQIHSSILLDFACIVLEIMDFDLLLEEQWLKPMNLFQIHFSVFFCRKVGTPDFVLLHFC